VDASLEFPQAALYLLLKTTQPAAIAHVVCGVQKSIRRSGDRKRPA
jgi:hypothetical protein